MGRHIAALLGTWLFALSLALVFAPPAAGSIRVSSSTSAFDLLQSDFEVISPLLPSMLIWRWLPFRIRFKVEP